MDTNNHYHIKNVTIQNFKSIKSITLSECRRINVLIGRPNVGKSNILEAFSLFDVPYLVHTSGKSLKNLVRVDNVSELFHNGSLDHPSEIVADDYSWKMVKNPNMGLTLDISHKEDSFKFSFNPSLYLTSKKDYNQYPPILTYFFPKQFVPESSGFDFLLPPGGGNMMQTVAHLPELKRNLAELFHGYGLKMVFDSGSQQIKAMRENGLDMFLIPFGSLADSLQRLIFYKSAIESNRNKTICFEEPEAHTFPPFISSVVNDIIANTDNQFFITTHSPYVLGSLLESAGDDLAIFIVDMKDNATMVKRLSETQLQTIYDDGLDMFFNLETFLK